MIGDVITVGNTLVHVCDIGDIWSSNEGYVVMWYGALCVVCVICCYCVFFFFQAEDGIRDTSVTGVQTCALPIY